MTNMLFATALILISLGTAVSSQFIRRRQIDLTVPQVILKPQKTQKEPRRPPLIESDKKTSSDLFVMTGISGEVRWKKEYGLPYNTGHESRPVHPYPCQVFKVRSTILAPAEPPLKFPPGTSVEVGTLKGKDFGTAGPPREDGDYYTCHFNVTDLPLNKTIDIRVDIDPSFLPPDYTGFDRSIRYTAPWVGGSQPQPPAGQFRQFTGFSKVTLSKSTPNARVIFEMQYRELKLERTR
jgi:hypothetical protein